LLSALAAAISASRVNVVEALTGRAGRRKGSKRWMFVGIAMVAAGVAAGIGGVALWSLPLMAAAIILAQLGMVACTPALLSFAARLGRWLPLAPRMALREAGRNRGSAAPAIAAVLGVVAAGMAFSMIVTADSVRNEQSRERVLNQDAMTLSLYNQSSDEAGPDWDAALAEARPILESRLDDVELTEVPLYSVETGCGVVPPEDEELWADCIWNIVRPEENRCSYWDAEKPDEDALRAAVEAARQDPRCDETETDTWGTQYDVPVSTDPEIVAAYTDLEGEELERAVAMLEAGGVLMADPRALTGDGTVMLRQDINVYDLNGDAVEPAPESVELELPAMAVERGQLGANRMLLSAEAAAAMGMAQTDWSRMYLVESPSEVDPAVVEALAADFNQEIAGGDVWANFQVVDYTDPFYFYFVIAVTGLCALIALGATAVSTGLIIAEQRRDMTTLGAVGAAPGLRKRFAMWQTVVIAVFGAGLGTAAGVVAYGLIREALNRPLQWEYPFPVLYGWELPWMSFGIMVLAVPVIAAAGAVVFTRAALPSERRIT
jgi:putative ABC transport system permease protein